MVEITLPTATADIIARAERAALEFQEKHGKGQVMGLGLRRVFMFGWVTGHSAGIVDTQAAIALLMSDDKKGKLS